MISQFHLKRRGGIVFTTGPPARLSTSFSRQAREPTDRAELGMPECRARSARAATPVRFAAFRAATAWSFLSRESWASPVLIVGQTIVCPDSWQTCHSLAAEYHSVADGIIEFAELSTELTWNCNKISHNSWCGNDCTYCRTDSDCNTQTKQFFVVWNNVFCNITCNMVERSSKYTFLLLTRSNLSGLPRKSCLWRICKAFSTCQGSI